MKDSNNKHPLQVLLFPSDGRDRQIRPLIVQGHARPRAVDAHRPGRAFCAAKDAEEVPACEPCDVLSGPAAFYELGHLFFESIVMPG